MLASIGMGLTAKADDEKPTATGQLIHNVFFTLKDHSKESRQKFLEAAKKYLTGHEGTVYFVCGVVAEDVSEPVSVKDFDVALHLVFASKEAEAKYIKDPRHVEFVEKCKESFAKVHVFDTYLVPMQ
jgi:hypothetical protein